MNLGDTFVMGTPGHRTKHFWIVISDPSDNGGEFVIVNLTSARSTKANCTLDVGDHPWIKKFSVVNFGDALCIRDDRNFQEAIRRRYVVPQVPMARSLVEHVREHARCSPSLSDRLKGML